MVAVAPLLKTGAAGPSSMFRTSVLVLRYFSGLPYPKYVIVSCGWQTAGVGGHSLICR